MQDKLKKERKLAVLLKISIVYHELWTLNVMKIVGK